jgi:Lrp/AsnC family transcriptional regulator for asnA, asnC and gidA
MAHTPGTPPASPGRSRGSGSGREPDSTRIVLDDLSKHIIEQLQQDGRRSYAAIGKAVGLSEAAVRQRVQRLIDVGAMQIVAVTDPMTLGFPRQTMVGIRCGGDLLVEVVCENDDQLLEILGRVRSIPSVTTTETFVYLKLCKQTYSWGTR